ncbi:MAG: 16S rRNA (cytidine(1402)-2'-O)-methyltransferase [Saprospiraceae bacterium]|nr:16S rRNA (cytidine(1402)-2'-O)-methyltransferase [Saprospiraceae bacterium]
MLYLVPTPIGHLEDMTYRAVAILKEVDYILSEDTRTTQFLLHHYQISKEVRSFHDHNEHGKLPSVLTDLQQGRTIALVSEAGMPGISDPGFLLVRACRQANLAMTVLPGPCALINALVSSGIPTEPFHFEGFLPHKKGRQTRLKYLGGLAATFILYESPHRFLKCLDELITICGPDRHSAVCRELTKKFEEVRPGTLLDQKNYYEKEGIVKGEFVLVVSGNPLAA